MLHPVCKMRSPVPNVFGIDAAGLPIYKASVVLVIMPNAASCSANDDSAPVENRPWASGPHHGSTVRTLPAIPHNLRPLVSSMNYRIRTASLHQSTDIF